MVRDPAAVGNDQVVRPCLADQVLVGGVPVVSRPGGLRQDASQQIGHQQRGDQHRGCRCGPAVRPGPRKPQHDRQRRHRDQHHPKLDVLRLPERVEHGVGGQRAGGEDRQRNPLFGVRRGIFGLAAQRDDARDGDGQARDARQRSRAQTQPPNRRCDAFGQEPVVGEEPPGLESRDGVVEEVEPVEEVQSADRPAEPHERFDRVGRRPRRPQPAGGGAFRPLDGLRKARTPVDRTRHAKVNASDHRGRHGAEHGQSAGERSERDRLPTAIPDGRDRRDQDRQQQDVLLVEQHGQREEASQGKEPSRRESVFGQIQQHQDAQQDKRQRQNVRLRLDAVPPEPVADGGHAGAQHAVEIVQSQPPREVKQHEDGRGGREHVVQLNRQPRVARVSGKPPRMVRDPIEAGEQHVVRVEQLAEVGAAHDLDVMARVLAFGMIRGQRQRVSAQDDRRQRPRQPGPSPGSRGRVPIDRVAGARPPSSFLSHRPVSGSVVALRQKPPQNHTLRAQAPGVRHQVSGARYQVSGVSFRLSAFRLCPLPTDHCPLTYIDEQVPFSRGFLNYWCFWEYVLPCQKFPSAATRGRKLLRRKHLQRRAIGTSRLPKPSSSQIRAERSRHNSRRPNDLNPPELLTVLAAPNCKNSGQWSVGSGQCPRSVPHHSSFIIHHSSFLFHP